MIPLSSQEFTPRLAHSRCSREADDVTPRNWHDSHVADPDTTRTTKPTAAYPDEPKNRWWSRLSPWLWGVLVLAVIVGTQVPRISHVFSPGTPRPGAVTTTRAPKLSGVAYTQAMVAAMNFVGADLRGARLAHLDLRGKEFRNANAAGAIFSGSLLNGADLSHADLRGADFSGACLQGSDLTGAELAGANFTGADVAGVSVAPTAVSDALGWDSVPTSAICFQS